MKRTCVLAVTLGLALLVIGSSASANDEKPLNNDFFADWGTGLAIVRNSKRAVTDAIIINNVVRVNSQSKYEATLLVAQHFYPFRDKRCSGGVMTRVTSGNCVGAMVGVGLGSSSDTGRLVNMIGVGLTMGGQGSPATKDAAATSAWNFGIGFGRKFGVQTLGDGFTENDPPPAGETQVRYKTRDITTQFVYFTAHW